MVQPRVCPVRVRVRVRIGSNPAELTMTLLGLAALTTLVLANCGLARFVSAPWRVLLTGRDEVRYGREELRPDRSQPGLQHNRGSSVSVRCHQSQQLALLLLLLLTGWDEVQRLARYGREELRPELLDRAHVDLSQPGTQNSSGSGDETGAHCEPTPQRERVRSVGAAASENGLDAWGELLSHCVWRE